MKTVELDPEEVELIRQHRKAKVEHQAKMLLQENCIHDFQYFGHSHNDDVYKCRFCDKMEDR